MKPAEDSEISSGVRPRLNTGKAATYLDRSPSTLAKLRVRGEGPAYLKLGRRVVYDIADLPS